MNFIKNLIKKPSIDEIDNSNLDIEIDFDENKDYGSMFKKDIDLSTIKTRDKSREHLDFPI